MNDILWFVSGGRILIAADSNSRLKTWHYVKINPRGRKMKEYLASNQLHIINEERDCFTFSKTRGSSNKDLTIPNNNLTAAVSGWEISAEESLSDDNYLNW